jgi:hypothetical protein
MQAGAATERWLDTRHMGICRQRSERGQAHRRRFQMTDRDEPLGRPETIRDSEHQRRDGRATDESTEVERGARDGGEAPTIAPEEKGGSPSTEHGPGADL